MNFIPIIMVVTFSIAYHVGQKSTPSGLNPMVALIVTYLTASVVSIIAYFLFIPKEGAIGMIASLKQVNWASYVLGFAVVGLELGYLLAYRAGWNITLTSLISNSLVALLLIPVGMFFFKESLSANTVSCSVFRVCSLFLNSLPKGVSYEKIHYRRRLLGGLSRSENWHRPG
jgi:hypothetical protein